jgi:hypothetical protein
VDAAPKHTSKYLSTYAALYPDARILVATITIKDFFLVSTAARAKDLSPILAALQADPASSPKLLVHLFSNGGVKTLYSLTQSYLTQTGQPLPATLLISDSAPGRPHFARDIYALTRNLPKNPVLFYFFSSFFVLAELLLLFIYNCTPFWQGLVRGPREAMADPKLIRKDAHMCFVYSAEDIVIDPKDVEQHVKDAQAVGWNVEIHRFEGSQHVSHMRLSPEKYWGILVGAWERAVGGNELVN